MAISLLRPAGSANYKWKSKVMGITITTIIIVVATDRGAIHKKKKKNDQEIPGVVVDKIYNIRARARTRLKIISVYTGPCAQQVRWRQITSSLSSVHKKKKKKLKNAMRCRPSSLNAQ